MTDILIQTLVENISIVEFGYLKSFNFLTPSKISLLL